MAITIKQGDTSPALQATIKDAAGTAVNLTGATVTLSIRSANGTILTNNAAVSITSAANGQVSYSWQPADTVNPGLYQYEFKITYGDGRKLHVPNTTNEILQILPSIT